MSAARPMFGGQWFFWKYVARKANLSLFSEIQHGVEIHDRGAADQHNGRPSLHAGELLCAQKTLILRCDTGHDENHARMSKDLIEQRCFAT